MRTVDLASHIGLYLDGNKVLLQYSINAMPTHRHSHYVIHMVVADILLLLLLVHKYRYDIAGICVRLLHHHGIGMNGTESREWLERTNKTQYARV
jgi:hypothetical protein